MTETITKPTKPEAAKVAALRPAAIDIDQVAAYLSLSVRTVNTLVQKSDYPKVKTDFPKPRQLAGRRVGYLLKEVDDWLEARPVSDQPPPVNCEFGRAGKP